MKTTTSFNLSTKKTHLVNVESMKRGQFGIVRQKTKGGHFGVCALVVKIDRGLVPLYYPHSDHDIGQVWTDGDYQVELLESLEFIGNLYE